MSDMSRLIAERLVHKKIEKLQESSVPIEYYKKVGDILNHRLGDYETGVSVENLELISKTPETVTFSVNYSVDVKIPVFNSETNTVEYDQDTEYLTQTITIDLD